MRRASLRRIDVSVINLLKPRSSTSCRATWSGGPCSTSAYTVSLSFLTCVAQRSITMKSAMGRCHAARRTSSRSRFRKTSYENSSSVSSRSLESENEGVFRGSASVPDNLKTGGSTGRPYRGSVCPSVNLCRGKSRWCWILCNRVGRLGPEKLGCCERRAVAIPSGKGHVEFHP